MFSFVGHVLGMEWHEAVGQYLDHSIVNMVTTSLSEISLEEIVRIAEVSMFSIRMHNELKIRKKSFSCTVKPIDEPWSVSDGCLEYKERDFFDI